VQNRTVIVYDQNFAHFALPVDPYRGKDPAALVGSLITRIVSPREDLQ
jgi:hypothetical protein